MIIHLVPAKVSCDEEYGFVVRIISHRATLLFSIAHTLLLSNWLTKTEQFIVSILLLLSAITK